MRTTCKLVGALLVLAAFALGMQAPATYGLGRQLNNANAKVDLNSASEKELESLPGVGAATAKKIISGRPYSSAEELSKAGVSAATIKKITPLVTFGNATPEPVRPAASKSAVPATPPASAAAGTKVDLNTASAAELKELPGVGDATARKIISARPISSVSDLSKAGVSAATINKITPLVTIGNAPVASVASQPARSAPNPPASSAAAPAPTPAASATPTASARTPPPALSPPGNGNVWVNTDSGVYHKEGTRYYGKTKNGKYMSEADAVKAGYRPAKNE
jgi:DNA uptake protein ComE-like DNA-binding protein